MSSKRSSSSSRALARGRAAQVVEAARPSRGSRGRSGSRRRRRTGRRGRSAARSAAASRTTSRPATRAVPPSGGSSVVRMRTAVVLPAPLGPSRPSTVPGGAEVDAAERLHVAVATCAAPPPRWRPRPASSRTLRIFFFPPPPTASAPRRLRIGRLLGALRTGASLYEMLPGRAVVPVPRVRRGGVAADPGGPPHPAHAGRHGAPRPARHRLLPDRARRRPSDPQRRRGQARVLMWSEVVYPGASACPDSGKVAIGRAPRWTF